MRKIAVFPALVIFILVFFSCDFKIPTAIEIFGNPDLVFSAIKDLAETFEKMSPTIEDPSNPGEKTILIYCINTDIRTYAIRHDFSYDVSGHYPPGEITAPALISLTGKNYIKSKLDFEDVLNGFSLEPATARIYLSGNADLIKALVIEVTISSDADPGNADTYYPAKINGMKSGISGDEYAGKKLPGSSDTDLVIPLNSGSTLTIEFEAKILAGTDIHGDWFNDPLDLEVVLWIPLVFDAAEGAEIRIGGLIFPEKSDVFGRSSPDEANPVGDYVESLTLSIVLNDNPFFGRDFVIWSGPDIDDRRIEIENKMDKKNINFPIDEDTMARLNEPDTYPFSPNFIIKYHDGDKLAIPWKLEAVQFVFKAKVNYRLEF